MVRIARGIFALSLLMAASVPLSCGCTATTPDGRHQQLMNVFGGVKDAASSVSSVTPPGSGVHEIALLVAAVAGAIVSVDSLARGGNSLAKMASKKKTPDE